MITTKIEVPPHLKEYLIGKFCNMQDSPIRFPDNTDIYHFIYDLLERRPCNVIDHGNLEIILPERSLGKNPKTYNYRKRVRDAAFFLIIMLVTFAATL